jgi:pimeloyl-ACP methyl ester carboxylesterase
MQVVSGYRDSDVRVRGIDFHVLEWGDAASPPMVLLHGLTGHAHIWDHMAPRLAERYHIFAPDQRGHGDTAHAASYATDDFVADLDALVASWGITSFVLMGLSMGGHNAIAYTARYPERATHLIIIDIPPKMDRRNAPNYAVNARLAETGHRTFATFDEAVADARAGTPTAPEEHLRYRTHWNLRALDGGALQFKYDPKVSALWDPADLTRELGAIGAPTLLVRGGKTVVLPRDRADAMVASTADGELIEIADSGHSVPTDRPAELTDAVLAWLARRA